jgi:serine/threonine protein kinase
MMTGVGVILGTAAYMSPEQARGRTADKRSDVWAFGCVLFEMLTGRRAFDGEEVSDTLASVLKGEPDSNALPADTPLSIRTLLKACLAKDPRQRIADISAALFVIDHQAALVPAIDVPIPATTPAQRAPLWRRTTSAAAVVVVGIFAGYGAWSLKPSVARAVTRFTITLSEGDQFSQSNSHAVSGGFRLIGRDRWCTLPCG